MATGPAGGCHPRRTCGRFGLQVPRWQGNKEGAIRYTALKIAVIYALASVVWILLSDRAVGWLTGDPLVTARMQQWKGLFFVLGTAALIFWLVRRGVAQLARSRETVAASERYFRALFEQAPTAYQSLDDEGRILDVNEAWLRLLGCGDRPEVLGRHIGEFLEESQLVLLQERFPNFKATGTLEDAEFVLQRRDGNLVTVTVDGRIQRDDDGQFLRTHCVLHDITDRKAHERALRDSERRLSLALDGARLGTFVWYMKGGTVRWSERQAELYGTTLDDFDGTSGDVLDRIHPDDRPDVQAELDRARSEDAMLVAEYRAVWPDGGHHWLGTAGRFQFDADGEPESLRGVTMDIDSRKRAEADRDRMEAELRLRIDAIETALSGFEIVDAQGRFLYANKAALNMWGYASVDEVVGREAVTHVADPAEGQRIIAAIREHGEISVEYTAMRKDGSTFEVWMIARATEDAEGRRVFMGTSIDVTERRQLEEQLRQARNMEAVGQLAGGVAHDFNNLLQVINGYAEMALGDLDESHPARHFVSEIGSAGGRAARLVGQLLAFSRRQVLEPEIVELNEVVEGLLEIAGRIVGESIRIDWTPGRQLGAVTADHGQLEQVLVNLWINSRDAMPGGGVLTIETENVRFDSDDCRLHAWARPGRYVMLSVTDSGSGMDQATIDRIWEPFFTTKPPGKGTGLGLSTVYGVVRQHDGLIHLSSEPGHGTTFKIYLPLVDRPAASVGDEEPAPTADSGETILVAEDNDEVRELVRNVLVQAGYDVVVVADGASALAHLQEHGADVDLALLDVIMPGLGGRDVHDQVRDRFPDLRFLFTSGYGPDGEHTDFVLDTGFELLQKPFVAGALTDRVRRILDQA